MDSKEFDASRYIEIDKIFEVFNTNNDKKVYCFGGGTAAEVFAGIIDGKYEIEAFLDNNLKLRT